MLDCFDGVLTLDATCAGGNGVIALNSIGINESLLAKLTDAEQTPASLLAECEAQARAIMHHDVTTWMAPRMIRRTFVDRATIGEANDRQEVMTGTGMGGIVIEIDNPKSNAILRLGRIGFWSDVGGPVPVEIYDLIDGALVDTLTVDTVAGQITNLSIQIALPAYRRRSAFFIATAEGSFFRVDTSAGNCVHCTRGNLGGGVHVWGGRIPAASAVSRGNIQRVSHTSGMLLLVTLECDHAQLLCEVKNELAYPYALKTAECIVRRGVHAVERLNTQRLDLDLLKERADRYGQEYAAAMSNTLGRMRLPDDPLCFTCVRPTMSTVSAP